MKINNALLLFRDRSHKSLLPENIRKFMQDKKLISAKDECVSFCGLIVSDDDFYMFVPRHVNVSKELSDNEKTSLAILTMKSVEKYARFHATSVFDSTTLEGDENMGMLCLARSLLEDYMQNGLYINKVRINHYQGGKIDWKRTLSRTIPLRGKNGVPVYAELQNTATRYRRDSPVALIQAEIIRELDKSFSWWITGRINTRLSAELDDSPVFNVSLDVKIRYLQNELHHVYSDRDIVLIKNLLSYLKDIRGTLDGHLVAGLGKFHFAWEEMLRRTLPYVINLKGSLPIPSYVKQDGSVEIARGMVTDIIISRDLKTTVVDAKYYSARSTSSAPGWPDLVKQFIYAKAVETIRPDHKVKNLFIFPGPVDEREKGPLKRVQMISPDKSTTYNDSFTPIDCYYLSPVTVMKAYVGNRLLENMEGLLD